MGEWSNLLIIFWGKNSKAYYGPHKPPLISTLYGNTSKRRFSNFVIFSPIRRRRCQGLPHGPAFERLQFQLRYLFPHP